MSRTKAKIKSDEREREEARLRLLSVTFEKRILVREDECPSGISGGPLRDEQGRRYYRCVLTPEVAAPLVKIPYEGLWRVYCVGGDGFWNHWLERSGLREDKARLCYDSVQDWATRKRLGALGFRLIWNR